MRNPPPASDPAVASALAYLRAHLPRLAALEVAPDGLRVGPHCVMEAGGAAILLRRLGEARGQDCVGLLARVRRLQALLGDEP